MVLFIIFTIRFPWMDVLFLSSTLKFLNFVITLLISTYVKNLKKKVHESTKWYLIAQMLNGE
jgi:hypothetical protein